MIAEEIMEIHRQVTPNCSLKPVFSMLRYFAPLSPWDDLLMSGDGFWLSQLSGRLLLNIQGREDRDGAC